MESDASVMVGMNLAKPGLKITASSNEDIVRPKTHNMLQIKLVWRSGYVEEGDGSTVTVDLTLEVASAVSGLRLDWWNICAAHEVTVFASAAAEGESFEQKLSIDDAVRKAELGKKNDHTILPGWDGATRRVRIVLGKRQTADSFYCNFGVRRLFVFGQPAGEGASAGSVEPGQQGAARNALLQDAQTRLSKQSIDAEITSVAADATGDIVPSDATVLDCALGHITEVIVKLGAAGTSKAKGGFMAIEEYDDDDGTMGEGGGEWPPAV